MAAMPELIYCANGNPRYAEIAINAGYTYGAQLPGTVYFHPEFVDQNWKKPDRAKYMAALSEHRPRMASVLDWEREEQLSEVMGWAEDAAQFVDIVMIVPKIHGSIAKLPRSIGGADVRLGYSVPTKHGGTEVMAFEFLGWAVHLLGGSPGAQMRIAATGLDVRSADGNMMQKLASSRCLFWRPGKRPFANGWISIEKADGEKWNGGAVDAGANYEAFRRSCENIRKAWSKMFAPHRHHLRRWRDTHSGGMA